MSRGKAKGECSGGHAGRRLLRRHRELLGLVASQGGSVRAEDFWTLLFLACRAMGPASPYEFLPLLEGPVSLTAREDVRFLAKVGLLEARGDALVLTQEGRTALGEQGSGGLGAAAARYQGLDGRALSQELARHFVVGSGPADTAEATGADEAAGASPLMTIGYEGTSLEGYLNRLLEHGVTLLCDVRRDPVSRKYGFSKRTLQRACETVGIRYVHLPELGIPFERRRRVRTHEDYAALFAEYQEGTLRGQSESLRRIAEWIASGERVALTCYERDPARCHRTLVAREVARLANERLAGRGDETCDERAGRQLPPRGERHAWKGGSARPGQVEVRHL